jgi:hypothetical protein
MTRSASGSAQPGRRVARARLDFYTMSENEEPDWLAELAKGGEAMRQQVEPVVQAALQFARLDWRNVSSLAVPLSLRLAAAADAAMRELKPHEPIVHQITLSGTITIGGSLALLPMSFAGQGEVAAATETLAVKAESGLSSGQAAQRVGQILALVLVALATWRLLDVPEHDRAAVDHYVTVLGFGLTLAVLIWSTQNKPK